VEDRKYRFGSLVIAFRSLNLRDDTSTKEVRAEQPIGYLALFFRRDEEGGITAMASLSTRTAEQSSQSQEVQRQHLRRKLTGEDLQAWPVDRKK
jgi:hypothetical protein